MAVARQYASAAPVRPLPTPLHRGHDTKSKRRVDVSLAFFPALPGTAVFIDFLPMLT